MINYDKEEYIKKKKAQLNNAYQLIADSINELKKNPSFIIDYLNVQSNFDLYSVRNALLVAKQMPNATQLKERKKWLDEKAIFTSRFPHHVIILDPKEFISGNKTIKSYNAKEMIDVSETNQRMQTKSYDKKMILQAIVAMSPVSIKVVDELAGARNSEWNIDDNVIYICRDDNQELVIKNLISELARVKLYQKNETIDEDKVSCITYMSCKKVGIDTEVSSLYSLKDKYATLNDKEIISNLADMRDVSLEINNLIINFLNCRQNSQETKTKRVSYER